MNSKAKDAITVFLIQLVLTLPFYTANVYGLAISNVKVASVASNSAVIEWNTDNLSNGKVKYGKTTFLGFTQRHDNFIENHTVAIFNGIDSDTSYFFIIESTDLAGNTAMDNNSNSFYTFKTTDITPPPQVTGLKAVSTTSNSVFLSWNNLSIQDLNHYVVYRNRVLIANSTANSFNDTGLSQNTNYNYKVSAVDNSSNEGPQSDTLIASTSSIDSTAPVISNIDVLTVTDTTARVTWLTNENATTIVLYGVNKTDKVKSSVDLEINHSIVIDGLTKNARVLFTVKSCDASNNCANSSNQSFIAGRDTTLPFISLSIPRFVNRRVIDIIGTTEPFSSVTLFVNNLNIPKRGLSGNEVGSSGKFIFSQIQLDQDNVIKIVMIDKSGNKNQKIFEVSIDTEDPAVQLNELPSITSKTNLTISGFVNEPVKIKVFVDINANESSVPSKITGLNTTKVGQNSVELRWDESKEKDFSQYVVYRADASPIAITKPANFNLFIDALVDSGKSYTYQVSAVNIFGKEGPKSDPITVTTLKGGAVLNLRPQEVDILEDFRKPLFVVNASGSFNFGIRLDNGDAAYHIKLMFEDRAENSVILEKSVTLDTTKPEIKITSPPSGAFIFENVANNIDVIGTTKPNARVHLFIDRTPFTLFNETFEISGLPDEVQDIPEANLDAKCRFNVAAKSFCRTGADFSMTADSQGNFKFEKVDLTAIFGGVARIREVPVTEFRDTRLEEAKESKTTTLVLIATDSTNQRGVATQAVRIGTCWSGNQSWDIIPFQQYQSPTLLSTERIAEGTETIYFYFNYSYIGRGTNARIDIVSISKACSTREVLDPRFNISCQILNGVPTRQLNPPDNTVSYSAVTLGRFPGMDRFLENDWKSFLKAINKELTFPLQVRIMYKHDTNNDGILETETQTTCEQVSYTVDSTILDPRKILPDWLLFDFVDILQDSITTLNQVQEQIDKLLEYVAVGCVASFGLKFILGAYRRIIVFAEESTYTALNLKTIGQFSEWIGLGKIKLTPEKKEDEDSCKALIDKIVRKYGSFKLKYVNDIYLEKCFPGSASAWAAEAKVDQFSRWSCYRVFGHAAPSRWTEKKDDTVLYNKVQSGEGCAIDQSVIGQPLKAESCTEFAKRHPKFDSVKSYGPDKKCLLLQRGIDKDTGTPRQAVFTVDEVQSEPEKLYRLSFIPQAGYFEETYLYAIKKDEFNYLTRQSQTCAEICGAGLAQDKIERKEKDKAGVTEVTIKKDGTQVRSLCTIVDNCRSLKSKDPNDKYKLIEEKEGKKTSVEITSVQTRGYTKDCFYDGTSVSVVSDSPALRKECCCINSKSAPPSNYYQPDDEDQVMGTQVHKSKKDIEAGQLTKLGKEDYAEMQWSYRYWKERFEAKGKDNTPHSSYHPYRYIEGRDLPACFGQNNIIYDAFNFNDGKVLTVDPFKQHEASIQCVHLAGVSNRIQFIKNLMTSLSTCLVQVRTTGRGDAGACKELFTQYLCGAIWQVIRAFVDGCVPIGFGTDIDTDDNKIATYLRAGISGVYGSLSDLQSEIRQEYGNAKLNELLGTGEESIARKICLFAFGYDWELNLRNLVDAAYATPFATLVQPVTRSREFLTVEPTARKPKYEYRASWVINPGCDFERYDVFLTCVGRKQLDLYPKSISCGSLGAPSIAYTGAVGGPSAGYSQCDCINLPEEKDSRLVFTGRLKQNALEDNSIPSGNRVHESNVRYDHLKFVLRPDRKITTNIRPNCFPQGYDDGVFYFPLIDKSPRDIFDCRVDYLSGSLLCGEGAAFATSKGIAYFEDIKISGVDPSDPSRLVFGAGEQLPITMKVRKVGSDKCIKASLDNVVFAVEGVTVNGSYEYSIVTPSLSVGQRDRVLKPSGLDILELDINNDKEFSIGVKFYDMDRSGDISFVSGDDEVEIGTEGRKKIRESKYFDNDYRLTISENSVKIQIVGATLQKSNGQPRDTIDIPGKGIIPTVGGAIIFRKAEQTTIPQEASRKTLTLALFNLKEGASSFNGNVDNCQLQDPVIYPDRPQERKIPITVELRAPKESLLQGPQIQDVTITPKRVKKGEDVKISVRFVNPLQVDSVSLTYSRPDAAQLVTIGLDRNSDGVFESVIKTDSLTLAGELKGKIKATGKNQKQSEKEIKFDVECGGENNNYGLCDSTGLCKSGDRTISVGLGGLDCPLQLGFPT